MFFCREPGTSLLLEQLVTFEVAGRRHVLCLQRLLGSGLLLACLLTVFLLVWLPSGWGYMDSVLRPPAFLCLSLLLATLGLLDLLLACLGGILVSHRGCGERSYTWLKLLLQAGISLLSCCLLLCPVLVTWHSHLLSQQDRCLSLPPPFFSSGLTSPSSPPPLLVASAPSSPCRGRCWEPPPPSPPGFHRFPATSGVH